MLKLGLEDIFSFRTFCLNIPLKILSASLSHGSWQLKTQINTHDPPFVPGPKRPDQLGS